MKAQPYTKADLERGEQIVKQLHGIQGYEAWAEHIAKALAAEREQSISQHRDDIVKRRAPDARGEW